MMNRQLTPAILLWLLFLETLSMVVAAPQPKATVSNFYIKGGICYVQIFSPGVTGTEYWEVTNSSKESPILNSASAFFNSEDAYWGVYQKASYAQLGNTYYLTVYTNGKITDTAKTIAI